MGGSLECAATDPFSRPINVSFSLSGYRKVDVITLEAGRGLTQRLMSLHPLDIFVKEFLIRRRHYEWQRQFHLKIYRIPANIAARNVLCWIIRVAPSRRRNILGRKWSGSTYKGYTWFLKPSLFHDREGRPFSTSRRSQGGIFKPSRDATQL